MQRNRGCRSLLRRHVLALGAALLAGCVRAPLSAPPPRALPAAIAQPSAEFFRAQPRDPRVRHVHMMHLDGIHADIFRAMLEADMLPHFKALLSRGKISYSAATVDKSETFKVIQSYLTARLDTEITGWWLFDRTQLQFHNYWLNPVDVVSYALGLDFPLYPTIFDVVAGHGENVAAGFNLHRRSVPFNNYSRAYVEGGVAAFRHTYFTQAHATMTQLLAVYERIARSADEPLPSFVMSLLAPADEYGHLQGIVMARRADGGLAPEEACFDRAARDARADDPYETIFEMLDDDRRSGGWITSLYQLGMSPADPDTGRATRYFTRVESSGGEIRRICIHVPEITSAAWPVTDAQVGSVPSARERANPNIVLAMIQIDVELGRLIEMLRSIRPLANGPDRFVPADHHGMPGYLRTGRSEGSLFENTLFVVISDHGMVNSPAKMAAPDAEHPDPGRDPRSLPHGFLEDLNARVQLVTPIHRQPAPPEARLGIDDRHLPLQLAFPHADPSWQSPAIRERVAAAERWTDEFLAELHEVVRSELYRNYWWLLFLRRLLIDPKLDAALTPYESVAHAIIAQLYLRGDAEYMAAERRFVREYYGSHVRLVYGGAALNNAEIFLPSTAAQEGWNARPQSSDIMTGAYADVLAALKANPGVGLIFVREQNAALMPGVPLPEQMVIFVTDRAGGAGRIRVRRDATTGILTFAYAVDSRRADPLGYDDLADDQWRTYNEWNDLSVERRHVYHNAVAGMGAYLYSTNPSIGDITAMHAPGWNFGDNSGGHGGLFREEKLSVMIVSGPGIEPGALMGEARYSAESGVVQPTDSATQPTMLDVAPTALGWLGYGDSALEDFARDGFPSHLDRWVRGQHADILLNLDNIDNLNDALRSIGFDDVRISDFRARLARLLEFLPSQPPPLPSYEDFRIDGNRLRLQ